MNERRVRTTLTTFMAAATAAAGLATAHAGPLADPAAPQEPPPTTQPAAPGAPGLPTPGVPTPDPGAIGEAVDFAHQVERAHGAAAFRQAGVLHASLEVRFGDDTVLDGELWYHDATGQARIVTSAGAILVFDGERAWAPPHADIPFGARFQLRAWSYFLTAPFKLRDPGTHLKREGLHTLRSRLVNAARLTFDAGIGDSSADWYLLYADPRTQQLAALAYIVSYGRSRAEAEQAPHAVVFERHQRVQDVLLPVAWTFHEWNEAEGPHGEPTGSVRVSSPRFVPYDASWFEKEAGMVEDPAR